MYALPALSALNPERLQPVDAPSTWWERGVQYFKPWKIEFRQTIEGDMSQGLRHVLRITVRDGVVSKQREMLAALSAKLGPVLERNGLTPMKGSGKLFTTCSDHSKSTLEWAYSQSYSGMMPLNGIPPVSAIPGGSPYIFLQMAFGDQPVELADSYYEWEQVPGIPPSVTLDVWQLTRKGDVGEEQLGLLGRLSRGAGYGESAE